MSAPIPQRETFLQRLPVAAAVVLLLLGTSVVAGYFLGREALLGWGSATGVPLQGALGLMLFGLALLGRDRLGRSWGAAAAVPALVGLVDLAAALSWISGGVGQWLGGAGAKAPAMVPVLAAAFALSGLAVVLGAFGRAARWRVAVLAAVGSLVGAAGLAAGLGHATGLAAATTLGLAGVLAPPGATGLLVLGCALVAVAVEERPDLSRPARWLPVPLMLGCVAATLVVWTALRQRETAQARAELELRSEALAAVLAVEFAGPVQALERIVAREDLGNEYTLRLRQADAQGLMRDHRAVERVSWLDAELRPAQVWTAAGEAKAGPFEHLGDPRRKAALERARRSGAVEVLAPPEGTQARPTVLLYAVLRRGPAAGFVAAELDASVWAAVALERIPAAGRDVAGLALGTHVLRGTLPAEPVAAPGLDRSFEIAGLPVRLVLVRSLGFGLPEVVFGSGVVFALLLGLVVDLGQKARARQGRAERTMERLLTEDAERRKVEARLKASEERLTLALEAGQVGVFDFDLITGEATYSPSVWKMLGRPAEPAPLRIAHWDGLIHAEDATAAKREFPRGPRPGYREAEYRVRSAVNEWRWILERAKAVAFTNDAVPRRIAGTFQDITVRREAEQALRTSQAEARKLAIVASITDNWVVITDAVGAVEWVNDSCGRAMGFAAAEAVGRALTELLPPAGENAAAGVLREAFVRRLPARVEIATVSRHGRRFNLQGEIQPVAGERGEVAKFIAVFNDLTVRIAAEQALRQAMVDAKAATDAKSDFLASMSHEIRTPMNGVIGLARILLESPLNPEQQDWVRTIQQSGDALLAIINDILDFSKIESGRMELEAAPFNLADTVEEALELFGLAAGAKQLDLSYSIAPGVPERVRGDVLRLRQVLVNLVGNAVKFTPAGRIAVEIRPGAEADQLFVGVADTGIGIPPERMEMLFQPFRQGDASLSRRFGGTGLGLAICRRLVELMGGTIGVAGRPNGGSLFHFTVRLPAEPAATTAAEQVPSGIGRRVAVLEDDPVAQRFIVQVLEREGYLVLCYDSLAAARTALAGGAAPDLLVVDRTLPDEDGVKAAAVLRALYPDADVPVVLLAPAGQAPTRAELAAAGGRGMAVKPLRRQALRDRVEAAWAARHAAGRAAGPVPPPAALPCLAEKIPLRVLLAEDNPVNKKVALRLLERLGYRADSVANGAEVVRAATEGDYQLVFMDVQMPELDGLQATRRIRDSLPPGRQPAIIALTANAIAGDAERCRAAGMDDYLSKPVTPEAIHNAIVRRFGAGLGIEPLAGGGLA